jgi:hypothetical protein
MDADYTWKLEDVLEIHWLVRYFHCLYIMVAPGSMDDLALHLHLNGPPEKYKC